MPFHLELRVHVYIGRTIKAILAGLESEWIGIDTPLAPLFIHASQFDWIGREKAIEPVRRTLSYAVACSRLGSYKIPYVISAQRRSRVTDDTGVVVDYR